MPQTHPKMLAELLSRAKEKATLAISLRVSVADIEAAKKIAAKRGVSYQTVLDVARRRSEIGIRMAVGATRGSVALGRLAAAVVLLVPVAMAAALAPARHVRCAILSSCNLPAVS